MPTTYQASKVVRALITLFESHPELGIEKIYYGDQESIPEAPAVCVEPGRFDRELAGVPFQTKNTFEILILIYSTGLGGNEQIQLQLDELTEAIQEMLHINAKDLGGLVTFGFSTRIEYGYSIKANRLVRANRITWTANSKTHLVQDATGNPL